MYKKDIYKYMPLIIKKARGLTHNHTYKIWGFEVPTQFIELHIANEKRKSETNYPIGYSSASIKDGHMAVPQTYLAYDKRIHMDSEFALIVLCHEVGHIINQLKDYNGNILKYNSLYNLDLVKTEKLAWKYGLQIYKTLPNINLDRWKKKRRKLLNGYIRWQTKKNNMNYTSSQSLYTLNAVKVHHTYQFSWINPDWPPNEFHEKQK